MVSRNLEFLLIGRALSIKLEENLTLSASVSFAFNAALHNLVGINIIADHRNQPDAMSNEFIMKSWGVVLHFDYVYSHGGELTNDDSPERISNWEIRVQQLEFDMIAREFKDLDLRLTWKPFGALPYHVFGFQDCSVQAVMRTRVLHLYLQLTNNFIITENLLILEFFEDEEKGQRYDNSRPSAQLRLLQRPPEWTQGTLG